MLRKETELMHASFVNHVHALWDDCGHVNSTNQRLNFHFPELKPLNVCCTNDVSAGWKLTKKGGCSKTKKCFCHCCGEKSDDLHVPNESTCDYCNDALNHCPKK